MNGIRILRNPLINQITRNQTALIFNRNYASTIKVEFENDIKFEELKEKHAKKQVTIIDSRTPPEANERGIIPGAILIPLNPFAHMFMSDNKSFRDIFGIDKPSKDDPIVTMCKLGIRARTAQMVLMAAGFTNVRTYVGSFEEWREKGGEYVIPKKPIEYEMKLEGHDFKF